MTMSRRAMLLATMAAATTGLTACGQPGPAPTASDTAPGPTPSPTDSPTPSATPTPTADTRPRWPLTGQLLTDPAAARRPAIAVKVPDNRNEHPQAGINEADLVFVQLEGYPDARGQSATRLMPVFHSTYPPNVAPVRSLRPVDVPLLAPAQAMIGSTGAAGWVENYVRNFGALVDGSHTYLKSRATGAYSIDRARVRTYQGETYYDRAVVCHPAALAKLAVGAFAAGPVRSWLHFATTDAEVSTVSGAPAPVVRVPWKQGATYDMTYQFDAASGRYRRSMPWGPHVTSAGDRVTTDNVLVVRCRQRVAKLFAGDGDAEPLHDIIDATGTFVYAHGGTHVTGTWSKGPVAEPFAFTLADGRPLRVAPGRTFVELPGPDADVRFA